MAGCRHPNESLGKAPGRKVKCGKCGKIVNKRLNGAEHGTSSGYFRHRREQSGSWGWPACLKCREAHTREVTAARQDEDVRARENVRKAAHRKALSRLRELYPADFAKLYAEELSLARGDVTLSVRRLEQEVAAILVGVYPPGTRYPEAVLRHAVADRSATLGEREAWRRVSSIRTRIRELREGK